MPQEGQGNPVVAFNGQNDCSWSNLLPVLFNHKIKGITSVKKAPVIPKILLKTKFLIV
jgi:hypothetical protein